MRTAQPCRNRPSRARGEDEAPQGKGNAMDAYTDTKLMLVKQAQAERRAEAATNRLATHPAPRRAPAPADGLVLNTARRLREASPG